MAFAPGAEVVISPVLTAALAAEMAPAAVSKRNPSPTLCESAHIPQSRGGGARKVDQAETKNLCQIVQLSETLANQRNGVQSWSRTSGRGAFWRKACHDPDESSENA